MRGVNNQVDALSKCQIWCLQWDGKIAILLKSPAPVCVRGCVWVCGCNAVCSHRRLTKPH